MSNRLGRLSINTKLIDSAVKGLAPDDIAALNAIFSRFIPIHAEMRYDTGAVEYIGWCRDFDEGPQHVEAPAYDVTISREVGYVGGAEVVTFSARFDRRAQR